MPGYDYDDKFPEPGIDAQFPPEVYAPPPIRRWVEQWVNENVVVNVDVALAQSAQALEIAETLQGVTSYAEALASAPDLPDGTNRIVMVADGMETAWVRDPAGPCLGGGWTPERDVTPQHFDLAAGVSAAFAAGMSLASNIGAKFRIPRKDYTVASSISVVLTKSLVVEFETGARLVAALGLAETVFYPRGAATEQASWNEIDLTIINPNIDCTQGNTPFGSGGGFCTALSFNYMRKVVVSGGYLYGGELPENNNADSGISWVTCGDVLIDGVHIRGFNDNGIYPGGNNTDGPDGNGGPCRVTNCVIQRCSGAIAAKREMDFLAVTNNVIEECLSGVSTQNVTSGGNVLGAKRIDVQGNTFRKIRANVIRPRGIAKAVIRDNTIIDWGYRYDGTSPTGGNGVAINFDGTIGADCSNNAFIIDEFPIDNQVGITFSTHNFEGIDYFPSNCFGSGNSFRRAPRCIAVASGGGPHTFLNFLVEGAGAAPFPATNANPDTLYTYRLDQGVQQLWIGGTIRPIAAPVIELVTTARTLTAVDCGKTFTNTGAGATVVFTLPSAAAGLEYTFSQLSNATITVQAVGNDMIRLPGGLTSTAAGTVTSAARGDFVTIRALDATNWCCVAHGGAWTAA